MSQIFLVSYVLNALWQVTVLALAAWLLARLAKPAGPELQHRIWVAALLLSALVPATPAIRSSFAAHPRIPSAHAPLTAAAHQAVRVIPPAESDLVFSPAALRMVSGIYLAALLFCFLRLCRMLQSTAALVRAADADAFEGHYAALWSASKQRFSIPSAVLLRSPAISGPVTAGLARPVLLLPAAFLENHSPTEFLAAIAHECAHIERDDYRKNVFYEVAALFTAFHPATWFLKSQIAQTREIICDRIAAGQLSDSRTYARALLQLAAKMQPVPAAASAAMGMFDAGILERRIVALTASLPELSGFERRLSTAVAILLLAICAAATGSMTRTVAARTASPTASAPRPPSRTAAVQAAAPTTPPPDLACTYYGNEPVGFAGTCAYGGAGEAKYVCYRNSDPAHRNPQTACEWKLRRFEEWSKSTKPRQ
jgi:beta-lactamase regulating signal transducer with metallopeptidase domain